MTKEDFADWKTNPVTKAFFAAIREKIEGIKMEMVGSALEGDATLSAVKAGAIIALEDIFEYRVEESL